MKVAAGTSGPPGEDLGDFARGKLTRVFGEARGARLYDEVLRALGADTVRSADELQAFARLLTDRGGMEAAVGGLLGVAATVRGARADTPRSSSG